MDGESWGGYYGGKGGKGSWGGYYGGKGGKGSKGSKGSKGNGGMGALMNAFVGEDMPGYAPAKPNRPNNAMYQPDSTSKYGDGGPSTRSKMTVAALFAEGATEISAAEISAATPSSISYSYSCLTITAAAVGVLLISLF